MNLGALLRTRASPANKKCFKIKQKWQYPAPPKSNDKPHKNSKIVNLENSNLFIDKIARTNVEKITYTHSQRKEAGSLFNTGEWQGNPLQLKSSPHLE